MNGSSFSSPVSCLALTLLMGGCAAEGGEPSQAGAADSLQNASNESRCTETESRVTCPHNIASLGLRDVHWQVPSGRPPVGGWPTVLMFQGSFFTAALSWDATRALPFGAFYQTMVIKRLLDHGFAVIAPEAHGEGLTFWDTNNPLFANNWEASGDHRLMLAIFDAIEQGKFGPLRGHRMYATGISSGGYMTSRMAVAYPERFAALGVQSGSYATCAGPLCSIPTLAASHPPTLLLHGSADLTVPIFTAKAYRDRLNAAGIENQLVAHEGDGHEWISEAPDAVLQWFTSHP